MRSDLDVAELMAGAGARGSMANVEINLAGITDAGYVQNVREKLAALRQRLGAKQSLA
jgi:formiminotetrahydrofolate cyclodeaminase